PPSLTLFPYTPLFRSVSTVLDASAEIGDFLASVASQTRPPDEIVIVDGGSVDGTVQALRAAPGVTLVEETGANIARGRNLAVRADRKSTRLNSSHEWI